MLIVFSSIGAVAGVGIARFLAPALNQDAVIVICCFGFFLAALLSSLGLINFLKFYYVKKYSIEAPSTKKKSVVKKKT